MRGGRLRVALGEALHDPALVRLVGRGDEALEHEAVHLRLRERIGAFLLDRVLRREDEERIRQAIRLVADRDLALLHRFEKGRLHLGGRAVDFVREKDVREDGPLLRGELTRLGVGLDVDVPCLIPCPCPCGALDGVRVLRAEGSYGVEVVGEKTFQGWDKLQRIIIGDSVREIGYSAFSGCTALTDVTFGKSVETIQAYAFTGCTALKDAVLSDSVTTVGDYAFSKCTALQNASFGSHVEKMGNLIFDGCTAFTDFRTGSNISAHTFEGNTTLVSLSMDDTVTEIGERAFSGCTKLQFITWSPNLQAIRSYAFAGCTTLNALSIHSNNELSIGDNAFSKCSGFPEYECATSVGISGQQQ